MTFRKNAFLVIASCFLIGAFALWKAKRFGYYRLSVNVKSSDLEEEWMDLEAKINSSVLRSRLPDVVCIGVEKCGTSALVNFLSLHPLMRTNPMGKIEAHFFDHGKTSADADEYYKRLPKVTDHELLMEKTPAYFNLPPYSTPKAMHSMMPEAKLLLILCDPVARVFSEFVHQKDAGHLGLISEEDFVKEMLLRFTNNGWVENEEKVKEKVLSVKEYKDMGLILTAGIYYVSVKRWWEYFRRDQILILDGEDFLKNPGEEMEKVQEFLKLPKLIRKEHFVVNPQTKMYCLRMPWWEKDFCMNKAKGKTRNQGKVHDTQIVQRLEKFYEPFNQRLYQLIEKTFNWK